MMPFTYGVASTLSDHVLTGHPERGGFQFDDQRMSAFVNGAGCDFEPPRFAFTIAGISYSSISPLIPRRWQPYRLSHAAKEPCEAAR